MYLYDPKLSGAQVRAGEQPICNCSHFNQGTIGLGKCRGRRGVHVWTNEGLGEASASKSGAPIAEIRILQESLNKWRVATSETPIKADGFLSPETKRAVLEFQKASGLKKQDGIFGPEARERLTLLLDILKNIPGEGIRQTGWPNGRLVGLVGGSGFRSLEGPTQTEVLRRIVLYGKLGTLDNIRLLTNLVHTLTFVLVPTSTQKLMLHALAARPDNDHLARVLAFLTASLSFRSFPVPRQTWVLKRIEGYAGNRGKIDNLFDLIMIFRFDQLSKENQQVMFVAHANNPNDARLVDNFRAVTERDDFRQLTQITQTEVLNRIVAYPRHPRNVENLVSLVIRTPGFGNLAPDVRTQILDGLPSRFGNVDLNPVMIGNMMTLVTALGFNKLRPEVRGLMLDLQAARPTNAQLATALGNLALGPKLHDRRIANQTIMQVNDSIP